MAAPGSSDPRSQSTWPALLGASGRSRHCLAGPERTLPSRRTEAGPLAGRRERGAAPRSRGFRRAPAPTARSRRRRRPISVE
eukprot:1642412-Prymnesium_polylepis.1